MKTLLLTLTILFATNASASQLAGTQWQTDYQKGIGIYTVEFHDNSTATVTIDPNRCAFNELGELSGMCTRMGPAEVSYTVEIANVKADRMTLAYNLSPENEMAQELRVVFSLFSGEIGQNLGKLLFLSHNGAVENRLFLKPHLDQAK